MPREPQRVIVAQHLIHTLYGHWLSNDPRGSGSTELRNEKLADLGPVHFGRKRVQPPKQEIRDFYKDAKPLLEHQTFWFDVAKRQATADAVGKAIAFHRYTVYEFAICGNHTHAVVRSHKDRAEVIWSNLANAMSAALQQFDDVGSNHPVWAARPYKVFLNTYDELWDRIEYVSDNPVKEHLLRQHWTFVTPCPFADTRPK